MKLFYTEDEIIAKLGYPYIEYETIEMIVDSPVNELDRICFPSCDLVASEVSMFRARYKRDRIYRDKKCTSVWILEGQREFVLDYFDIDRT